MALAALTATLLPNKFAVLVFSKTGGFRHDSIPEGIEAIKLLGSRFKFDVTATEDSGAFAPANLAKFRVVVFLNTTGDILDEAQQTAFENFVNSGGGYVGVHAASDTEYDWPWYGRTMGAWFKVHPAIQEATITVEDRKHATTSFLPPVWKFTDEWYDYRTNPRGRVHVLASLDETSYKGGTMGDHPVMWCQNVGKGRSWYTNLGHRKETYQDSNFLRSLKEGVFWAGAVSEGGKKWDPTGGGDHENSRFPVR